MTVTHVYIHSITHLYDTYVLGSHVTDPLNQSDTGHKELAL